MIFFKLLLAIIFLLPNSGYTYPKSLDDVYKKQLEIENRLEEIYEDLVARISYKNDIANAKAEVRTFPCSKYFISMKDYGDSTFDNTSLNKTEQFFQTSFEKCMALYSLIEPLTQEIKYQYYKNFTSEMDGYGKNPYQQVWKDIALHPKYLEMIKMYIDSSSFNFYVCVLESEEDKIKLCKSNSPNQKSNKK